MDRLSLKIARRFVARHSIRALEVGRGVFTDHLKLHHFHGSLRITDLINAGKRGKKVKELTLIPKTLKDDLADKIIKHAVSTILHMNYGQAKSHLEKVLEDVKESQGSGYEGLFTLHEQELRGIDVESRGTSLDLEKKFPDGTTVKIDASPHDFLIVHSAVIRAPGKSADGYRQDTSYWPKAKKDGITFYGWLKDNLSKAANMTILDLLDVWKVLGVQYNSH